MFSVLIPVYNHRDYLLAAILSALREPLVNEVLLVDDGSDDGSHQFVNQQAGNIDTRIRILETPEGENKGAHARLNQLAEEASSEWLAPLNSDDCFTAGRFDLLSRLLRNKNRTFISGHLAIMDHNGKSIGSKRGPMTPEFPFPAGLDIAALLSANELLPILACQNFIATTSNMIFKKTLFEEIGGFADLRYIHDWDFALRATIKGNAIYAPQFLTIYRSHDNNTIKENIDATTAEVRGMFQKLQTDLPGHWDQADVKRGLGGNRYLAT